MPNDREFRLPRTLIAVLAVNAGIAMAAYGSCDAPSPEVSFQVAPGPTGPLVVTAPLFVSTPLEPAPDEIEPVREEVATAPGPSQLGRDPFAGQPQSPDAGTRDPCSACGRG